MYIVFEGTVGTGKTTQSKKLVTYLQKQFPTREVLRVREPGSTPITDAIRTLVQATSFDEDMDPLCEAYLYAASRAQLIQTIIKPALARGVIIVSDRSFWSSLAYQGYAKGQGIETIRTINQPIVQSGLPDIVLLFDMPVDIGLSRTSDSAGDKHEKNKKEFFAQAYIGYTKCLQDIRFAKQSAIIDATGTQDEVFSRICTIILPSIS